MEIPNVGKFLIRGQIAAIDFDEFLVLDTLVRINLQLTLNYERMQQIKQFRQKKKEMENLT